MTEAHEEKVQHVRRARQGGIGYGDAYVPGQEARMDPSDEYLAVAHELQEWITARIGGAP